MADGEETVEALKEALKEKQDEVAAAKKKMSTWKAKMRDIVEAERAEITQLRDGREEDRKQIEMLEAELVNLRQAADQGGRPTTEPTPETNSEVTRWKELAEKLAEEKDAIADDFERFKERTNVAMKLRGKELASKQSKHSNLEEDLRSAQAEFEIERNQRKQKELALQRLEEQAAQASISVARQFEMATNESERARQLFEAEKMALQAQHREALQELRDQFDNAQAAAARLHEDELQKVLLRIDEVQALAVKGSQQRVDNLVAQNVKLQASVEESEAEVRQLKEEIKAQEEEKREPGVSEHEVKELQMKIRRLQEENEHQAKRIWTLQREVIEAKDAAGELKEKPQSVEELSHLQQQAYLRAVLINFLTSKTDELRGSLIPLLATLLQLSANDLKDIYTENPNWAL